MRNYMNGLDGVVRNLLVAILYSTIMLLLNGCGGGSGGKDSGDDTQEQGPSSFLYQDLELLTLDGHQLTSIIVDTNTGFFIAPQYSTESTLNSALSGAVFGMAGDVARLMLGHDGLPEQIIFKNGEILAFSDYGLASVRVTLFSESGVVLGEEIVELDSNQLSALRSLVRDLGFRVEDLGMPIESRMPIERASLQIATDANLRVLSLGLNVVSCGLSTATAFSLGGLAIPLAAAACGNLALKVWAYGTGGDDFAIVATGLDIAGCGSAFLGEASGVFDCASLIAEHMRVTRTNYSSVTVYVDGEGYGDVVSYASGLYCSSGESPCFWRFADNMNVELEARASGGSRFENWGGDCLGFSPICEIPTNIDRTIRATFNAQPSVSEYSLTIIKNGNGAGLVRSSPPGINCGLDCYALFVEGTSVTLTAEPLPGASFEGWDGDCTGSGTCTLLMSENKALLAHFVAILPPDPPPPVGEDPPPTMGYLTFLEGNPGIEEDGIFITSSQTTLTNFSLTVEPKPLVGTFEDGVTLTVITRLPRTTAYAQIYFEFGYSGTQCLVRVHDNHVVRPQKAAFEAAYYSRNVLSSITDAVRGGISSSGAIITSSVGCSEAELSKMFFNRIDFLHFGLNAIELDAAILDVGLVTR